MTSETEHYRSEAAQLRAAMRGILDPLMVAQMREVAEHFDTVAGQLEHAGSTPAFVRDGAYYHQQGLKIRAAMSLIADDTALKHLGEAARHYEILAAEVDRRVRDATGP